MLKKSFSFQNHSLLKRESFLKIQKSQFFSETRGFASGIQDRVTNTKNYCKSIIKEQLVNGTYRTSFESSQTIKHILFFCSVLINRNYKKRKTLTKILHLNLALKFNLTKNAKPYYSF